ncbi:hypothetical protein [Actinomyces urogenitalis]|uniref:hypothetical protein n=1 Tax=Actinomyces urogenitalis TaxID=103621 RepID=UPI00242AFA42|nr:hypothetical protein [Actinomyces urogenitalis]MCI7457801.1 hypothetical protein [Actinomyces urogenitalis]
MTLISRRTLTKGALWAIPAAALASTAPASAAAQPTAETEIDELFTSFCAGLPDLTGVELIISFHSAVHQNGALGEHSIHLTNMGTKTLDAGSCPLMIEFAYKNVDSSPAVNQTFTHDATVANLFGGNTSPVRTPWNPSGSNSSLAPGDAVGIGQCDPRRDLSWGSSNFTVYDVSTYRVIARNPTEVREESARCLPDGDGAYGWLLSFTATGKGAITPDSYKNVLATHARDSMTSGGRTYVAQGMKFHGYLPPTWDQVLSAAKVAHTELSSEQIEATYYDAYTARVERWKQRGEGLCGAVIKVAGWSSYYSTRDDVRGWVRAINADEWVWSHEVGNFMAAGAENRKLYISGVNRWTAQQVRTSSPTQSVTEIRHRDGII